MQIKLFEKAVEDNEPEKKRLSRLGGPKETRLQTNERKIKQNEEIIARIM